MNKDTDNTHIRNPFAGTTNEKQVWKDLLRASKPVSKEEFSEKVKATRKDT